MDYEKKYKEALGWMQSVYPTMTGADKEDAEHFFPELKESEDEKIRKWIIDYFKENNAALAFKGISNESVLAWLEKQGAKVSAIEGFETEFERQVSHLIASAINKEHEYNQGYVKWTANALLNYAKHELEKQGEQNPTDWSLPYGKNETADKLIALAECLEMDGDCLFNGLSGDDYGKFLRVLAIELTEVNPAWSEEDRRILDEVIYMSENHLQLNAWDISWLKFLKNRCLPQPRREWSEEDEIMIYGITIDIEELIEQNAYDETQLRKEIDWLKSLKDRYTWKPSDEQMDALYTYIYNPQYFDPRMELVESLYNDLKKLKQ